MTREVVGHCRACGCALKWRMDLADGLCSFATTANEVSDSCLARLHKWAPLKVWWAPETPEQRAEQAVMIDAWLQAGAP